MTNRPHITVQGAGIAGLCAACELALRGERVTIVDANRHAGGNVHILRDRRFSFDTGPVVLTDPTLFEGLFARAGRDAADYYRLFELDPQPRFWFDDGVAINLNRRTEVFARMLDQQLQLTRPGSEWLKFMELFTPPVRSTARDWLGIIIDPGLDVAVQRAVKEKHLAQICNYLTGYLADGTSCITDRVEHGMWYPMGGMREIVKALERLAAELGVLFSYQTQSASDELVTTQVFNSAQADCQPAHPRLMFFLGLKKRYEHLTFLNVFLGSDSKQEFDALYKKGTLSLNPTIEVVSPCIIDPVHAPFGGDAMRVAIQVPSWHTPDTWRGPGGLVEKYRDAIFKRLQRSGMEDIEDRIMVEYVLTPPDSQTMCISTGECREVSIAATDGIEAANIILSGSESLNSVRV